MEIRFKPWIGKNYQSGGIFGKKILVLGESHYCDDSEGTDFTTAVVNDYLNPEVERDKWMNTFLKFERSLVNHITDTEESKKIWDSIAFYNYLQFPMDGARQAGTKRQYSDSIGPFFEVLNDLRPELLIVWGSRLWNNLPNEGWVGGKEIEIDGYSIMNGAYKLNDGSLVRTICVYHPSVGYSWDYWYRAIQSVLE